MNKYVQPRTRSELEYRREQVLEAIKRIEEEQERMLESDATNYTVGEVLQFLRGQLMSLNFALRIETEPDPTSAHQAIALLDQAYQLVYDAAGGFEGDFSVEQIGDALDRMKERFPDWEKSYND